MSSIRAEGLSTIARAPKTIRCFVHVVQTPDPDNLADFVQAKLKDWDFVTPACIVLVESQLANSLEDAVENSRKTHDLYPDSMQLVIGADLLTGSQPKELLQAAQQEFGRGYLGVIHLGSNMPKGAVALDGAIRSNNVKSETRRVVRLLNYRRPVRRVSPPCAPQARLVNSRDDFEASLRLRFNVYDLMGYIPERYRSERTGLEMDNLDKYSLHYVSHLPGENDDQPVASLRLITRRRQRDSMRWMAHTLRENPDRRLKRSVRTSQFQELPVFNAIKCLEEFQAMLQSEEAEYCELSRMVVDESCRGMGLSRQLIELALADARLRGIRCVVLACVPEQVRMYEKYGFLHFPSDIVRFARVEQPAQALFQFL